MRKKGRADRPVQDTPSFAAVQPDVVRKVKPCPFCGKPLYHHYKQRKDANGEWKNENAYVHLNLGCVLSHFEITDRSVDMWNRRAE